MQMYYDRKRKVMLCMSADNKVEAFAVNVDKPESILKKLTRQTKKSIKRTHSEANETEDKFDKEALELKLKDRDYDFALHFSKPDSWVVDFENKARSFQLLPVSTSFQILVSFHSNRVVHYEFEFGTEHKYKQIATIGEHSTH